MLPLSLAILRRRLLPEQATRGRWDDGERSSESHERPLPGDDDLLDRAAVESWLKGAAVHAVPAAEIPGGGMAIAGLRY